LVVPPPPAACLNRIQFGNRSSTPLIKRRGTAGTFLGPRRAGPWFSNWTRFRRISKLNAQGRIFDEKARSLQAADTLHHRAVRALMGVDDLGNMDGGKVPGDRMASSMVRCIDRS